MKKNKLLLGVSMVFASVAASSCDLIMQFLPFLKKDDGDTINLKTEGGTKEQQTAIFEAINSRDLVFVNGGETAVNPNSSYTLAGETYDFVKVTTKQSILIDGIKYSVAITWSGDSLATKSEYPTSIDENHARYDFTYPTTEGAVGTSELKITKMTCGQCSTVAGEEVKYTLKLAAATTQYDQYSIAQLNKVTNGKMDIIDYTVTNKDADNAIWPWFKVNHNQDSMFVKTYGEVIYLAPDGNWGLIAEGDEVMEIYAGSGEGRKLTTAEFPALQVGKKVMVYGNMAQYCGNAQISFIYKIDPLPAGITCASATAIANARAITASDWASMELGGGKHQQFVQGMMNQVRTIEGTYVAGSLKNKSNTAASSINASNRFYFYLNVGGHNVQVAYDYHTTKKDNNGDTSANDLISKLNSVVSNGTKTFVIKGTMRYTDGKSDAKKWDYNHFAGNLGEWSLVPWDGAMITQK